ncbi:MAG: hypothetical protein ACRDRH_21360 [Pseudonocardia sp.]
MAAIIGRFISIGLRPTTITKRLHSRLPQPSETVELKLRPDIPVIIAVRICHSGGTAIETADLLFAANQSKLEYSLTVEPLDWLHKNAKGAVPTMR